MRKGREVRPNGVVIYVVVHAETRRQTYRIKGERPATSWDYLYNARKHADSLTPGKGALALSLLECCEACDDQL